MKTAAGQSCKIQGINTVLDHQIHTPQYDSFPLLIQLGILSCEVKDKGDMDSKPQQVTLPVVTEKNSILLMCPVTSFLNKVRHLD